MTTKAEFRAAVAAMPGPDDAARTGGTSVNDTGKFLTEEHRNCAFYTVWKSCRTMKYRFVLSVPRRQWHRYRVPLEEALTTAESDYREEMEDAASTPWKGKDYAASVGITVECAHQAEVWHVGTGKSQHEPGENWDYKTRDLPPRAFAAATAPDATRGTVSGRVSERDYIKYLEGEVARLRKLCGEDA